MFFKHAQMPLPSLRFKIFATSGWNWIIQQTLLQYSCSFKNVELNNKILFTCDSWKGKFRILKG